MVGMGLPTPPSLISPASSRPFPSGSVTSISGVQAGLPEAHAGLGQRAGFDERDLKVIGGQRLPECVCEDLPEAGIIFDQQDALFHPGPSS